MKRENRRKKTQMKITYEKNRGVDYVIWNQDAKAQIYSSR